MICKGYNRIKTITRNLSTYKFSGTIGSARYPCFSKPKWIQRHVHPRPVVKSCPYNVGYVLLQNNKWM